MQIYEIVVDDEQREETQHGFYDFPMAIYEDQHDKLVLGYVNWHWHEEIQFAYISRGSIEVSAGNESVVLEEGDGIFINSEILHKSRPVSRPDSEMICLCIHPRLLSGFAGSRVGQQYVLPYINDENLTCRVLRDNDEEERIVVDCMKQVYEMYKKAEAGWELEVQIKLLQCWKVFTGLAPMEARGEVSSRDVDRLKSMLQIVSERYGEKLTLEDFSANLHLSTAECCRLFKRQMQCTLFEYLLDYRLEQSFKRLQDTQDTISNIAYDCGFSSTSYYIKRFREKTGMTPLEFRKNKRWPYRR